MDNKQVNSYSALWICWCNFAPSGRDAYLTWLHGAHIQKLAMKHCILWAAHYEVHKHDIPTRMHHTKDPSVPAGNDFILILDAASSHPFSRSLGTYVNSGTPDENDDWTIEDRRTNA